MSSNLVIIICHSDSSETEVPGRYAMSYFGFAPTESADAPLQSFDVGCNSLIYGSVIAERAIIPAKLRAD
jgi:hypothetical protein